MFALHSRDVIDSLSDVSSSDDEDEITKSKVSSPDDEIAVPSQRFAPVSLTEVLRKRNKVARVLYSSSKILPKYWKRRYDLFERFDEGVQLDEVS
uniref:S-adenosylmethionine-dependent methyltransferase related n=1 Tax=Schistosoma mansoni TaxID=6183 RepID=A0A5K4E9H7_SCHMA